MLDIVDFYMSINKDLLHKALTCVQQLVSITQDEIEIIMHATKSLLSDNDQAWVKKDTSAFDVTMGSHDSAKVCELVGSFIL